MMKIRLLTCGYFCFIVLNLQAQHYKHTTFWLKTALSAPLSQKWEMQLEYVHRQQNDLHGSLWNPFSRESLEEPRLWFLYRKNNFITFQLNPISYIYSKQLLGKEADYTATPNKEWRSAVGIIFTERTGKWQFQQRMQYEGRWILANNYALTTRLRLRVMAQYLINDKTRLQCFNEFFFNEPPHVAPVRHDQNWFLIGISHRINEHMTIDLGVMHNKKVRVNKVEIDDENALNLGLNFRI